MIPTLILLGCFLFGLLGGMTKEEDSGANDSDYYDDFWDN